MREFFITEKRRIKQKIWQALDNYLLPHIGSGVVLAISGGPDSRALLEGVSSWPNRVKGRFIVFTMDHRSRADSANEAEFISRRAKRLGFECEKISLPIAKILTGEKDLRDIRYEEIKRVATKAKCSVICTAHQQDDNSEGYIMSLLGVGGGSLGAAMEYLEFKENFLHCRPFLDLDKKDLLLYLTTIGVNDFVRDLLDEKSLGSRALVRNQLMPKLNRFSPRVAGRLSKLSKAQREQNKFLESSSANFVLWTDDGATICLKNKPHAALITNSLWFILKRISNNRDLRSCQPTIERIVKDSIDDDTYNVNYSKGLDQEDCKTSLRRRNNKEYRLPGAIAHKNAEKIVIKAD